jgi:hypothetical protein
MSHHHHREEDKSYDQYYYLVGLLAGLFTGACIEKGIVWVLVGGIVGLLTAGLYIKTAVRNRAQ